MNVPVRSLKGVGAKTEGLLGKLGIQAVADLLCYYPARYESYELAVPIGALVEGEEHTVCAHPLSFPHLVSTGAKQMLTVKLKDVSSEETIQASWFGQLYLRNILRPGGTYFFTGKAVRRGKDLVLSQPEVHTLDQMQKLQKRLQPVYRLTKGLSNSTMKRLMESALDLVEAEGEGGGFPEYLPSEVLSAFPLVSEGEARRGVHFPRDEESLANCRRRLVFDEFFLFLLSVQRLKLRAGTVPNAFPMKKDWDGEHIIEKLPFALTKAQRRTWEEVEDDLSGRFLMNRLVQGDVGCGKTMVAFLAILMAVRSGYQAALMVPTEVLARQHLESFQELIKSQELQGVHPVLLTGSLTAAGHRRVYEEIGSGKANVIIGTQALIQEGVPYRKLALAVIDEQHRFGVGQRQILSARENPPHLLVMSATPIPRTLALILYGDLDISLIDELPGNRLPIKNAAVTAAWRANAYRFIERQVHEGHQAYVICPMVDESEGLEAENVVDYAEKLREALSADIAIGILHGQMKNKEKDSVMESFARGDLKVLVSTTVVEVGVNVPNATVMMVENAERFGLAQLHQLRGRVGRGSAQSYCIFVQGGKEEEASKRLAFLSKTNDGFAVAGEDLRIRGQGDFFGTRQSGEFLFALGDIYRDADLLKQASDAAGMVLSKDWALQEAEHAALKKRLLEAYPEGTMVSL